MNDANINATQQSPAVHGVENNKARQSYPRLRFYHPNNKGTGSAAEFEMRPVYGTHDGVIFAKFAPQKSVATGSFATGDRQFATFDWQSHITVKLNFTDLCQILAVLKGRQESIAEGKGLYHNSASATTFIAVTRQTGAFAGYSFEVSRRTKDNAQPTRIFICLRDAEAFGLGIAIAGVMPFIAFGVPKEPTWLDSMDANPFGKDAPMPGAAGTGMTPLASAAQAIVDDE